MGCLGKRGPTGKNTGRETANDGQGERPLGRSLA